MFYTHVTFVVCKIVNVFLRKSKENQAYLQSFLEFGPMYLYLMAYMNIQFMQFVDLEENLAICYDESE